MPTFEAQLEELYRSRYRGFVEVVASVAGGYDRAHDAVQEGFARALASENGFRGGSLEAWVMRIALNAAIDTRRRDRDRPFTGEVADPRPVRADRDPDLEHALLALPPRRRLMVFLRYFADLSYADIAAVTGTSEGTVAATLNQAHAALRDALSEPQEIGP